MKAQVFEILNHTADALDRCGPAKWTRGVAARDSGGNPVPLHSKSASQWSVLGYVVKAVESRNMPPTVAKDAVVALTQAARGLGYTWLDDVEGYHQARMVVAEACSL